MAKQMAIIVHGGAGTHSAIAHDSTSRKVIEDGVKVAVRKGWQVLTSGGSALDAVEAAVVCMEDDVTFNAGIGSCYTNRGDVEMDATLMDGTTLRAGGVACVKNIANPIKLARVILEESDHCLMVGEGAREFAVSRGMPLVPDDYHNSEKSARRLKMFQKFRPAVNAEFDPRSRLQTGGSTGQSESQKQSWSGKAEVEDHDTVGAVVVDGEGNVAFANSTGGITAKLPGRCGDSSIIGAGGYADNQVGTVATTGHGESFIKTCLARHFCYLMEKGESPQEACETSLAYMKHQVGGIGGLIALDPQGRGGVWFTTEGMSWASIYGDQTKLHWGIYHGEDFSEDL